MKESKLTQNAGSLKIKDFRNKKTTASGIVQFNNKKLKPNDLVSSVESDSQVHTVTAAGKPAKQRVSTAEAAWTVYDSFKKAYETVSYQRAKIQGLVDGNPPYDEVKLRQLGLGFKTNVNFLEMRAVLDSSAGAAHELYGEVPTLIELKLNVPESDNLPLLAWARVIAEEFSTTVSDWSGFLPFMDMVARESDKLGLGVGGWTNEYDWRPKAFETGNFLTYSTARFDLDSLQVFCLRDEIPASTLLEKLSAKAPDWNLPNLRKLLDKVYNQDRGDTGDGNQTSDYEEAQKEIRNYDDPDQEVTDFRGVPVVHIVVQEMDTGKVSHLIIPDDDEMKFFIYEGRNRFEKMSHILWWLPYNYGNGFVRSAQGLATMLRPHCELSDRFLCNIFDGGQIAASMVIQPNTPTDASQLQIVRMGPFTVLPAGLNAIQSTFAPNVSALIQLRELSSQIMKNNTGIYRQHPEMFGENQVQKTARQVAEETAKEARHEKSHVAFRYMFYDRLYREMFRRLTQPVMLDAEDGIDSPGKAEALDFAQRCVSRGVPFDIIRQASSLFRVYATRAIGLGSLGVRLDLTNQLLQVRGMLDEQGKVNAVREWLTVRVGHSNVDRFKAPINRDLIPVNEQSIATLENNDFVEGSVVPVGSDQVHVIHIRTHLEPISEVMQVFEQTQGQGFDFEKALTIFRIALPHVSQHLVYLQEDPAYQEFVQQVVELVQKATQLAGVFEAQVKRMQEARQKLEQERAQQVADAQEQVMSADMALKKYEIDKKYELEAMKQVSLNDMRRVKTDEQMDIRRRQTEASVELQKQKTIADIEIAARKTDADIALKQAAASEVG
jgi:DNA-binding transcriptional regulator YdaS (Cro superfamily)